MMSELRESSLENLFAEANRDLEGEAITAQVMARTRNRLFTLVVGGITATLVALLIGWYLFAGPLLEFAVLISQFLTNPLVDLGQGWLALALMPINNFASITVLLAKGAMMGWKKLTGTSLLR